MGEKKLGGVLFLPGARFCENVINFTTTTMTTQPTTSTPLTTFSLLKQRLLFLWSHQGMAYVPFHHPWFFPEQLLVLLCEKKKWHDKKLSDENFDDVTQICYNLSKKI